MLKHEITTKRLKHPHDPPPTHPPTDRLKVSFFFFFFPFFFFTELALNEAQSPKDPLRASSSIRRDNWPTSSYGFPVRSRPPWPQSSWTRLGRNGAHI